MPGDASNYQVVLRATIQKITQEQLQEAVRGLSINVPLKLDPTQKSQLEKEIKETKDKAGGSSGKGTPILDIKTDLTNLQILENRLKQIKSTIDPNAKITNLTNSQSGITTSGTISYGAGGKAIAENYRMLDSQGKITNEIKDQAKFVQATEKSTSKILNENNNLANTLGNNAKKVAEWAISTALIYGTLQEIRKAMEYIISLNKEMTNIQIVTGMSPQETGALAGQYNQLAKEMGATTLEVAKGSVEWFRQGKSISEANELVKSSLMMSKLGNMESAQATEYLTSTLNGFKMEAEDSVGIIDKLVALDNNYATSVGRQNCRNT